MVRTLRKVARLERRRLQVAVRAAVWLLVVDVGLRTIGLKRVREVLQRLSPFRPLADSRPETMLEALQRGVDLAARHHLYPMTCLPRSLVLQHLLARAGVQSDLRLGVRKADGRLHAHAWVEQGSRPIGEPMVVTSRFAPLVTREAGR